MISKNVLRVDEIRNMAKKVMNSGPDRNRKAKLEQLLILQELHEAYESKRLKSACFRCTLS